MSETPLKPVEIEEKRIKPELKVISGGRDGDGDWLSRLPFMSTFLARPKFDPSTGHPYRGFMLMEFIAYGWYGRARNVLQEGQNGGPQQLLLVDTVKFSDTMELFDVIRREEDGDKTSD